MTETEFRAWPSTPRLFRDIVITEKIDGTNSCVIVQKFVFGHHSTEPVPADAKLVFSSDDDEGGMPLCEFLVAAQSRKKLITPDSDNAGFARWVWDNAEELANTLGEGYHYGEWWGSKIQRTYGLTNGDKRFSLFNVKRWEDSLDELETVPGLSIVPVLYKGGFSESKISTVIERLRTFGSVAMPGYMNPEGVVVFHSAAQQVFKVLLENDHLSKTEVGVR